MAEITLDTRGLRCPLPVLKLEKRLGSLAAGDTITLLATDAIARIDIPLYCVQHGYGCDIGEADGVLRFTITPIVA